MNARDRMFLTPILLAALLAGGPGCSRRQGPAHAAADSRSPITVRTVRVESRGGGSELVVPGRVAARGEVVVRATISGRITALPFREGQRFSNGAVLARFEAPERRASVAAALSAEQAARHRAEVARRQESRLDSLVAGRVAALRELELAQDERLAADAAYEAASAAREALLSGSEIRAPFSGVVVRRHVDPGATAAAGEPVLDIRSGGTSEIVAAIPEAWLPALQSSRIDLRVGGGPWVEARTLRVEGMTDFRSRTREARFAPVSGHGTLEAGAYADVRLARGGAISGTASSRPDEPGAELLRVPSGTLVRRGALTGVFVIRDGRAWL
ncbi:MAG TPA: efflux RND transporter periplasmic adaptor subunit, partial [Candidatus Eisenbacteria bacterium]|nr:efflux RND transporter periplasmic adaptor subunit [Candidatus Eisenbacteria bacterium]